MKLATTFVRSLQVDMQAELRGIERAATGTRAPVGASGPSSAGR